MSSMVYVCPECEIRIDPDEPVVALEAATWEEHGGQEVAGPVHRLAFHLKHAPEGWQHRRSREGTLRELLKA